jgi:hypothetical protein
MFRKIASELTKRALPSLKPKSRFFSHSPLPIPHSLEYMSLLEAEFKNINKPYNKKILAQGTRLIMCNTHTFDEVYLDAFPMFLKEDTHSILTAYEEFMAKYNQFHSNIVEYELNKSITCLSSETKPNQVNYFIHTNAMELRLKKLHALPNFLEAIKNFVPASPPKSP